MTCTTSSLTSQSQLPSCNFLTVWNLSATFVHNLDQACESSANFEPRKCLFGNLMISSQNIESYPVVSKRWSSLLYKLGIYFWKQTRLNHAESVPPTIFILLIFLLDLLLLGADNVRCNQVTAVAMISLGIRSIAASWIPATVLKGSSSTAHCGRVVFKLLSWSASCTLRRKAGGIMRSDPKLLVVTCNAIPSTRPSARKCTQIGFIQRIMHICVS